MNKHFSVSMLAFVFIAAAPAPAILTGIWSGEGHSIRATSSQSIVQNQCDVGRITGPIKLDSNGRFAADGYFNTTTSGIRLSDVAPNDRPARFIGVVKGNKLQLTIKVVGTTKSYTLVRGVTLSFKRCR